jgi:hypothetical protein
MHWPQRRGDDVIPAPMTPAPPLAANLIARPDPDLRPAHRPEGSTGPEENDVALFISNGA